MDLKNLLSATSNPTERRTKPLKHRAFHAGGWTLIGHFASLILRMAASLVLTRIFAPDTFGILSIIGAITAVIGMLTDIGLRQSIIQSPNGSDPTFLNTAWTLQIVRGLVIWGLSSLFALGLHFASVWHFLPGGSVYAETKLPEFMIISSFSAVILGFQSIKTMTANRELDLKRVTAIEILSQVLGLIFVVSLGWLTRSIWIYIASLLLTPATGVVMSHVWLRGSRDRLSWDRDALAELRRFGKWVFISSSLGAAASNGDRLLLAGWVSPAVLGYYSLASNLATVGVVLAGKIFANVALPALSEVARSRSRDFSKLLFRMRWLSDPTLLFLAGFLFATGQAIVAFLYDPRYASAGPMLQWLSFSLVFVRYDLAFAAYMALGLPNYITVISCTKLISLFTFVPILFYAFGVKGAVLGIACHMLPATFWLLFFNRRRKIQNFYLEGSVLFAWPVGWLAGSGVLSILSFLGLHWAVH
jgi:O-antigen/teichoic acid export membrane protein